MSHRLEQIHSELKKFSLKPSEKMQIRRALISYIQENPIFEKKAIVSGRVSDFSINIDTLANFQWHKFFRSSSYVSVLVIISLLLGGGGVSLAAENALPGDALYSVKNINESLQSFLTVSDEDQAALQIKLTNERLKEAEQLAVKGKLSQSASTELTNKLERHVNTFKEKVKNLEDNKSYPSAVSAAASLTSTLKVHEDVLSVLATNDQSTASDTAAVAAQVQVALNDVQTSQVTSKDKVDANDAPDIQISAKDAIDSAQKILSNARQYVESNKDTMGEDTYVDATARLSSSVQSLKEAQVSFDSQQYGVAFSNAQDAAGKAQETQGFLETTFSLNISPDGKLKLASTTSDGLDICLTDTDCKTGYECFFATSTTSSSTKAVADTSTSTNRSTALCRPARPLKNTSQDASTTSISTSSDPVDSLTTTTPSSL